MGLEEDRLFIAMVVLAGLARVTLSAVVILTHRTREKPSLIYRDAHDAAQLTSRCCQQAGAWRIVTKVHFGSTR